MPVPPETEWVTRFLPIRSAHVELRDDDRVLTGMPIVFNSRSKDLGGFVEIIDASAVDRTIREGTNVDLLVDHRRETTAIMASTDSGLLRQKKERDGLRIEARPPDTSDVRDLVTKIKAGLVTGMSFAFRVMPGGQQWTEEADGRLLRRVTDMQYSEFSYVLGPAYLATTASARNAAVDRQALDEYLATRTFRPSRKFRERMARLIR